jgi:hypothetical protein
MGGVVGDEKNEQFYTEIWNLKNIILDNLICALQVRFMLIQEVGK